MKIEHAYSTDLDEDIDIETAYELFWAGRIRDKHSFMCLYPGCDGPITAANLEKLRQDMKVDPYFVRVREALHTPACELHGGQEVGRPDVTAAPGGQRGRKDEALADQFALTRPQSHRVSVQVAPEDPAQPKVRKRRRREGEGGAAAPRPHTSYSVGSLVSRLYKYRRLGIADQKRLVIKGFRLSYEEMFVPIEGLDVDSVPDHFRVYFGRAFVGEHPTGYRVGFVDEVSMDGERYKPSLFVSRKSIEAAFSRNLLQQKLDDLSARRRPDAWFFVYGKPKRIESNGKSYVNFALSNLDYLDFREGFVPETAAGEEP